MSADKEEIEEYIQREYQEKQEVKQSREREEDSLIAENRILSIEVVNKVNLVISVRFLRFDQVYTNSLFLLRQYSFVRPVYQV